MNPEVNVTTELPPRTYVDYRTPDNFTNHSPKMKNEQATTNYDFAGDVRCRSALLCALSDEPLSCMHQVSRHFARSFLLRISERLRWLNMDVGAYVLALYIEHYNELWERDVPTISSSQPWRSGTRIGP